MRRAIARTMRRVRPPSALALLLAGLLAAGPGAAEETAPATDGQGARAQDARPGAGTPAGVPPGADSGGGTDDSAAARFRVSGSIGVFHGRQEASAASIYPAEGRIGEAATVSRKTHLVLRLASPGLVSAVADVQSDRRPYAGDFNRVNQLYAGIDVSDTLKLRIGKQRVLWGRGFVFVPTDFVNPPLDPSGLDLAKVGVPALSFDYLGADWSLTGLLRRERGRLDSAGLKFSPSLVSGVDLDLIYYHAPSIGNAAAVSFGIDAEQHLSPRLSGLVLFGGAAVHTRARYPAAVEQAGAGGGALLLPGDAGRRGRHVSWLAGATYQASSSLILLGELYRIGDAYAAHDNRRVLEALADRGSARQLSSLPWLSHLSYGRNQRRYLNLSVNQGSLTEGRHRITDTLGVELAMLRSLDDDSGMTSFALICNYWDRTEITLRSFFPRGGRATEFGTSPYKWHAELGVRIGF